MHVKCRFIVIAHYYEAVRQNFTHKLCSLINKHSDVTISTYFCCLHPNRSSMASMDIVNFLTRALTLRTARAHAVSTHAGLNIHKQISARAQFTQNARPASPCCEPPSPSMSCASCPLLLYATRNLHRNTTISGQRMLCTSFSLLKLPRSLRRLRFIPGFQQSKTAGLRWSMHTHRIKFNLRGQTQTTSKLCSRRSGGRSSTSPVITEKRVEGFEG